MSVPLLSNAVGLPSITTNSERNRASTNAYCGSLAVWESARGTGCVLIRWSDQNRIGRGTAVACLLCTVPTCDAKAWPHTLWRARIAHFDLPIFSVGDYETLKKPAYGEKGTDMPSVAETGAEDMLGLSHNLKMATVTSAHSMSLFTYSSKPRQGLCTAAHTSA